MKFFTLIIFMIFIMPVYGNVALDDSDLSTPIHEIIDSNDFFRADNIEVLDNDRGQTIIEIKITKNDITRDIVSPEFILGIDCQNNQGKRFSAIGELKNQWTKIENHKGEVYDLIFNGECGKKHILSFDFDSFGGQAMSIFELVMRAKEKFSKIDRLDFWKEKLIVVYPSNGDFYNWRAVHVTKGHYWDVVGHELGHAIYDMANMGSFGGGYHRIDECYSTTLALSEGWASFFSAWLSLDLSDPDAKFEYMVPRRAPLQVEHIPADVCKGQKNEWRVYGFFLGSNRFK